MGALCSAGRASALVTGARCTNVNYVYFCVHCECRKTLCIFEHIDMITQQCMSQKHMGRIMNKVISTPDTIASCHMAAHSAGRVVLGNVPATHDRSKQVLGKKPAVHPALKQQAVM